MVCICFPIEAKKTEGKRGKVITPEKKEKKRRKRGSGVYISKIEVVDKGGKRKECVYVCVPVCGYWVCLAKKEETVAD